MAMWKEDLNQRKANVKGLFSNSNTRPMIFIMAGVVISMLVIGYMSLTRARTDSQVAADSSVRSQGPNVQTDPSANASAEHRRLQEEANRAGIAAAQANQQSSLPALIGTAGSGEPLSLPALPTAPVNNPPNNYAIPPAPVLGPKLPEVSQVSQPPMSSPPQPEIVREASKGMNNQILGYLNMWGPQDNALQEFAYARSAKARADTTAPETISPGAPNSASASSNGAFNDPPLIRFVRAGTAVPAKMLTPITSDSPGPVLAEIVSGPLAGARLIGAMSIQREAILIKFNSINKPGWPESYKISAIGLSSDGYTGMATEVNHHYAQRYLSLLAGGFLSGYGTGLAQQGSQTIITDAGAVITQQDELNPTQIRNQALGKVGTGIGEEIQKRGERPTTIEIKGKDGRPFQFQVLFLEGF